MRRLTTKSSVVYCRVICQKYPNAKYQKHCYLLQVHDVKSSGECVDTKDDVVT